MSIRVECDNDRVVIVMDGESYPMEIGCATKFWFEFAEALKVAAKASKKARKAAKEGPSRSSGP